MNPLTHFFELITSTIREFSNLFITHLLLRLSIHSKRVETSSTDGATGTNIGSDFHLGGGGWMRDAVEVTIANILLSPLRFAVAIGQRNE